jgi:O-succinylbenzoic acid--CoA ligase
MQSRIPNIIISDAVEGETLQLITDFYDEWTNQEDFIEVYTSGSTGTPKNVQLSKEKVRKSARATGAFFGFEKGQKLVLNLSVHHIAGKLMLVRAWEFEMTIIVLPVSRNPLSEKGVKDLFTSSNPIHFGAFVPYQVKAILADVTTKALFENIQQVIIGGAPIAVNLENELRSLSNTIFATFGMTETITHFALRNIHQDQPVYECLPGFEVSTDDRNCLVLEENPITDCLITNDRVNLLDANHFEWLGREDFVINSGGVKISPEVIERKVAQILGQNSYFFFGQNDVELGERVVLFVESEDNLDKHQIQQHIKKYLDKYEQPKHIYIVSTFERTGSGKVIRKDYSV